MQLETALSIASHGRIHILMTKFALFNRKPREFHILVLLRLCSRSMHYLSQAWGAPHHSSLFLAAYMQLETAVSIASHGRILILMTKLALFLSQTTGVLLRAYVQ